MAAAQLAQSSAPRRDHSIVKTSNESSNAREPRDTRREVPQIDTNDIRAIQDSEPQFDPRLSSGIPDAATVPRRRKKSQRSPFATVFGIVLGGVAGLAAGYAVLCHIDVRYDFLHLLAAEKPITEAPILPHGPDTETRKPPAPRVPKKPHNRLPPVVPELPRKRPAPSKLEPKLRPEPVRQDDPFANVPLQLPLPVPQSSNTPISITPVPLEQLDNFELTLLIGDEVLKDRLTLARLPQEGESMNWMWAIRWMSNIPSDVATFSILNKELRFAWSAEPNKTAVAAIRNSILRIRANQYEHFMALRNPTLEAPHTFDLNKPVDRVVCHCGDLPDINKIRVDVV